MSDAQTAPVSKKILWAGRVISALPLLFLLFDSAIKLMKIEPVVESFAQLGYPVSLALGIGIPELVCTGVYMIPRTSSDENGGVTRHPMSPTWPLETLNTLALSEHGGKTTLTIRSVPHGATEEERKTFEAGFDSM